METRDPFGYTTDAQGFGYYAGLHIQADPIAHVEIARLASKLVPPGGRVLDVAAGTGSLAQRLLDLGFEVHCTTWNDRLRVDAPAYRLDLDRAFTLEAVGGEPFDLVVASEIIEHVENPAALLRSCAAVVAPDGAVIVATPNVADVRSRVQWLLRGYPEIYSPNAVVRNRHISMIFHAGFVRIAETAGLTVEEHVPLADYSDESWAKRALLWLLARGMGPHAWGGTSMYLLRPSPTGAMPHGPETVL